MAQLRARVRAHRARAVLRVQQDLGDEGQAPSPAGRGEPSGIVYDRTSGGVSCGVFSPMIVLKEAIDVCGQVAEEVVKGIGCQINCRGNPVEVVYC
jgi:hypothetical protein